MIFRLKYSRTLRFFYNFDAKSSKMSKSKVMSKLNFMTKIRVFLIRCNIKVNLSRSNTIHFSVIVKDWMSWYKKSLQFVDKTPKSEWNNSNMTSSICNLHSITCKQNSTKRNDLNVKEKNCYIQNSLLMPTLPMELQILQYL